FVPLYKFHSRWKDALKGDLGSYYERYETTFMGYVPTKVNFVYKRYHNWLPAQAEIDPAGITEVTEVNRYYFDKIVKLCEEYGTELKILKTPTKAWPIELREATAELAEEYGIEYTDMNDPEILAEVGIDESKDFADEYSHLNIYGAEKVSRWIAKYWQETEDFTDKRGDGSDTAAFWDSEYARYEAYKSAE
ncbi:MAG: hypothetical protein HUJ75_04700, partial [Parasporobacterium sp.]|nr:hypothetical protein [Parasporobacterium sp.]